MMHVRVGSEGDKCAHCGALLSEYCDPPDNAEIGKLRVDAELKRYLGALHCEGAED